MQEALLLIEAVVLIIIFYQDIRYRAVSWLAFLVFAISGFVFSFMSTGFFVAITNSLINCTVIMIQLSLVYLFYYFKTGKNPKILNSKLGLGDILMLFALALVFSPLLFLLFIFSSFIISLIISLSRKNPQSIPLAGYQAILYLIYIILNYFIFDLNQIQLELYNL